MITNHRFMRKSQNNSEQRVSVQDQGDLLVLLLLLIKKCIPVKIFLKIFSTCWSMKYGKTQIPYYSFQNLCAILLSTIYFSPKNLGRKLEIIWATKNLGINLGKNERFSTKFQLYICLSSLLLVVIPVILLSIVSLWTLQSELFHIMEFTICPVTTRVYSDDGSVQNDGYT